MPRETVKAVVLILCNLFSCYLILAVIIAFFHLKNTNSKSHVFHRLSLHLLAADEVYILLNVLVDIYTFQVAQGWAELPEIVVEATKKLAMMSIVPYFASTFLALLITLQRLLVVTYQRGEMVLFHPNRLWILLAGVWGLCVTHLLVMVIAGGCTVIIYPQYYFSESCSNQKVFNVLYFMHHIRWWLPVGMAASYAVIFVELRYAPFARLTYGTSFKKDKHAKLRDYRVLLQAVLISVAFLVDSIFGFFITLNGFFAEFLVFSDVMRCTVHAVVFLAFNRAVRKQFYWLPCGNCGAGHQMSPTTVQTKK